VIDLRQQSSKQTEPVGGGIPADLVGEAAPIRLGTDDQQLGIHHIREVSQFLGADGMGEDGVVWSTSGEPALG
jgi:hypothetical protein